MDHPLLRLLRDSMYSCHVYVSQQEHVNSLCDPSTSAVRSVLAEVLLLLMVVGMANG
jgi:hypothetical protein